MRVRSCKEIVQSNSGFQLSAVILTLPLQRFPIITLFWHFHSGIDFYKGRICCLCGNYSAHCSLWLLLKSNWLGSSILPPSMRLPDVFVSYMFCFLFVCHADQTQLLMGACAIPGLSKSLDGVGNGEYILIDVSSVWLDFSHIFYCVFVLWFLLITPWYDLFWKTKNQIQATRRLFLED